MDTKSTPTSLSTGCLVPSADAVSVTGSENVDDFTDGGVLGDELDSILDSIADGTQQYPLVSLAFLAMELSSFFFSVTHLQPSLTPVPKQ